MIAQSATSFLYVFFLTLVVIGVVTALVSFIQQNKKPATTSLVEGGILDSLPDALFVLDETAAILSANPAALRMVGFQQRELQGTSSSLLFPSPSFREALHHTRPKSKEQNAGELREIVTDVITAHGEQKRVSVVVSPIEGTPSRRFLRARELHHLSQSNALDSHDISSITALAAGIGHELSSMFSSVAQISSSGKSVENPTMVRDILDQINQTANSGSKLACRLPKFGKDLRPQRTLCDLEPIVRVVTEKMIFGTDIECEYEFEEKLPSVLIDRKLIEQVLTNMILNSVQAMPLGGLLNIAATSMHKKSMAGESQITRIVRLTITDTGSGIESEDIRKIFDSFYTTKPGANGLGLASSSAIIRRHGGDITVLSTPNKGTTFHIFLPAHYGGSLPSTHNQFDTPDEAPGGLLLIV